MKPFFLITLILYCFVVTAQQTPTYYDQLSAAETYSAGRLLSRQYYNEAGDAEADTTNKDRLAACEEDWLKYLSNHIDFRQAVNIFQEEF